MTSVPFTVAQFRSDFSEFGDTSKYPDALVTMWMAVGALRVSNADRWGSLLATGQELVTAHFLVLAVREQVAGAAGGMPGGPLGLATSESVGPVSVTYDFSGTTLAEAGNWNSTSYGQRYFQLARLIGAGGFQLPFPLC